MLGRALAVSFVVLTAAGCGSSTSSSGPTGYSLTLDAKLNATNGQVAFVTPAASVVQVPVANIVGKPYLVASFKAGFSPGNDPAIDSQWGKVGDDLQIHYTTPATYKDGPYDMVVVIYAATAVSDDVMKQPAQNAPAAVHGDLASFTFDNGQVKPGDPKIAPGVVRLNVEGKNASIDVENRPPADPTNQDQLKVAFNNVIMIVP